MDNTTTADYDDEEPIFTEEIAGGLAEDSFDPSEICHNIPRGYDFFCQHPATQGCCCSHHSKSTEAFDVNTYHREDSKDSNLSEEVIRRDDCYHFFCPNPTPSKGLI